MPVFYESLSEQIAQAQGLVKRGDPRRDPLDRTILRTFLPHLVLVVLGFSLWWSGGPFEDEQIIKFISTIGFWFAVGIVILSGYEVIELERKADYRERQFKVWERIELAKARIEPEAKPRVPFAPESFVKFIWDWRDKLGKFPTVDECEQNKFNRALVQEWYQNMVSVGAVVNRTPRQAAGEPGTGWTRARFEQAARDANTI